ncbi:MAG: hypothetical protein KGI82_00370 [Betaproteobacteria bacterium]|nr:hypothetical protein [Betaproteobacteria bacterium]
MNIETDLRDVEHAARQDLLSADEALKRAIAGVEAWYEQHFHAAAVAGRQPIPASDKAALIEHVTGAVNPGKE